MKLVNICIPLYNRGYNVTKLLHNINDIYNNVDKKIDVKVIIGDFHSTDIDFESIIPLLDVPVHIIQLEGTFNMVKSLQTCSDYVSDPDEIIMHSDADVVFENGSETIFNMCELVKKGETYSSPICGTEQMPFRWSYTFNGSFYVPTEDHHGGGILIIYNEDYKRLNGYTNDPYMGERGEIWGQHENILKSRLSSLVRIRKINPYIWSRCHERDGNIKWFSQDGANHFNSH